MVQGRLEDHEPQDLTPMQDVGQMSGGMSSSPDTPGKKDRNSRKQCPYCTKGQPVIRIVSLVENFCWKAYSIKSALSIHALMVFKFLACAVQEKN